MTVDPWILAFSVVTVVATIWMGFWSARKSKTASDFFVAGRSVSVGWNASAISGEYLSAASFMGVAGMVMSSGYDALWYPVCYACGYLFLLLFIAGPLRRFGAYTIPDFAEGRFDSPVFRKIAVVFVLFIGFFYTMPQMKGAGTTLAYVFQAVDLRDSWLEFLAPHNPAGDALKGFPYSAGVLVVGAVITLNVALGGMKGITLVQAFQYWMKMFAISVPIFVLMTVYGHYGKQLDTNATGPGLKLRTIWDPRPRSATSLSEWVDAKVADLLAIPNAPSGVQVRMQFANEKVWLFDEAIITPVRPLNAEESEKLRTTKDIRMAQEEVWRARGIGVIESERELLLVRLERFPELKEAYARGGLSALKMPKGRSSVTEIGRKPLPDKAPKDETWLNPFGPLTTKAAKAAKPLSIRFDGELVVTNASLLNGRLMSFTEPQNLAHNRGPKKEEAITPGTYPSSDFVRLYAEVLLLGETDSNPEFSARHAKPLEASSLVWTNGTRQPRRDLDKAMEIALAGAGITVLRESGNVFRAFPTKDAVITPVDPRPYSLLYTYSLIIALVCGTAGLPHILVRFYTNPDGVAAKRTTMWVMILIGVFYVFPPVFGVMGRNLLPSLYEGVGAKGTDKVVLELPGILNEMPDKKSSMLNAQSGTNSLSNEHRASAIDHRRRIPWGSILSGITCAGAFAAFMSTFSGLLVSMTGAMAHDVYGRMINPDATPEERLRAFKIAAVVIGGVAILLGTQVEPLQINFMVGQAFAIAAASYFPLLFVSVWWRKLTMKGAATGMLTGGTLALAGISLTSFTDLKWLPLDGFWAAHPLLRILCEQPAIWAVPLAIALMVIVSKLTQKDVPSDIRMKMLVLHAPEKLGLKQEYIQEHQTDH
jgi:Na+(H+)/acetate symporter ActP